MNKAIPWSISGVGFDAREIAREAARRQGRSLGEWLHGVIADHAAELGLDAQDVGDQDRIDAVTAKLERLSRTPDTDRRGRRDHRLEIGRPHALRRDPDGNDDDRSIRRGSHRREPLVDSRRGRRGATTDELLLEDAIDAMERRAARAERRNEDAIASVTRMLEANEAKRASERDSVQDLAQKLTAIEAKLTHHDDADATPIKGALSRLETRLEAISRRATAEGSARQTAARSLFQRRVDNEPIHRLEDKLNSILAAVGVAPKASDTEAAATSAGHRSLGEAIADISRRQVALDGPEPEAVATSRQPPHGQPDDTSWQHALGTMQSEISALTTKIDDMRRDVLRPRPETAGGTDIDALRSEIKAVSQILGNLAPRASGATLRGSIDALARRVAAARDQGVQDHLLGQIDMLIGDLRGAFAGIDPRPTLGLIEREIRIIAEILAGLTVTNAPALARLRAQMQDIREILSSTTAGPLAVEELDSFVSALATQVGRIVYEPAESRDLDRTSASIRAVLAEAQNRMRALDRIEIHLADVAKKLQAIQGVQNGADVAGLERQMRDLGQKIEGAVTRGADRSTVEALQQKVALLSAKFEQARNQGASTAANPVRGLSGADRSSFDALHQKVELLSAKFEQARDQGASTAANPVRGLNSNAVAADMKPPGPAPAKTDERTLSTLNAVHQTLEYMVGRMSAMETDMAQMRRSPEADSAVEVAATSKRAPDISLPRIEPVHEPSFTAMPKRPPQGQLGQRTASEDDPGRADFIAAARRATKVAQAEPSIVAFRQPMGQARSEARSGLLERSRDYVATNKRPVLLGVAAVFVVAGTMAIVQRMTFDTSDDKMAAMSAPSHIDRMADAGVTATRGDLTPSTLPSGSRALAAQIPGSDPIQTGSIDSNTAAALPAFAAQGATMAARSGLPASLLSMAQSGNESAEYELASRYADGKAVPRDFKLAAQWFAKAADQGLAPAQYRLAALYEKGLGLAQDKARARALYTQAAQAGNPRAMHNLAVLLADGDGHPNYASAATWFRKAAQYGVHDSQYNLAILLARGLGVDQSLVQAYQWFAIAASHDDPDAAKKRDEVGDKLSANDLALAKALAAAFQPTTPNLAATNVAAPPGGWDSVSASSQINSGGSKISAL